MTLSDWLFLSIFILLSIVTLLSLIIYFTSIGRFRILKELDSILLNLKRRNLITLLLSLPKNSEVEEELKSIRELEEELGVPEMDFTDSLNKYYETKKIVEERGYI